MYLNHSCKSIFSPHLHTHSSIAKPGTPVEEDVQTKMADFGLGYRKQLLSVVYYITLTCYILKTSDARKKSLSDSGSGHLSPTSILQCHYD